MLLDALLLAEHEKGSEVLRNPSILFILGCDLEFLCFEALGLHDDKV